MKNTSFQSHAIILRHLTFCPKNKVAATMSNNWRKENPEPKQTGTSGGEQVELPV